MALRSFSGIENMSDQREKRDSFIVVLEDECCLLFCKSNGNTFATGHLLLKTIISLCVLPGWKNERLNKNAGK